MNKPLTILLALVLLAAFAGVSGCKRAEIIDESSVIGSWEVKSWVSNDHRFDGCNMLGTLTFSKEDWGGIRVTFTFTRDGAPQTTIGYARLEDLPKIKFDVGFLGRSIDFDGFIEDGRMIGRLGGDWSGQAFYGDNEWWEAVKK